MPTREVPRPAEELVVQLVERPHQALTRRELHGLGEGGATLLRWGALRQHETLTSAACRSCGEDHLVELQFEPATRAWRYYCGSVGFVAMAEDELVNFRFDLGWLFDRLTELLRIGRPDRAALIDGVLWRLGVARSADLRFWTAMVARDVVLHLDPILEQLQRPGRDRGGLVLTGSAEVPYRVPLPNGYRWLPLRDLLDAESGELRVQEGAIRRALAGVPARAVLPRPPGRPSVESLVLGEFRRRSRAGEVEPTLRAEAAALRSWLMIGHPDTGGRSLGTVENIVRSAHASWRQGNPRSTK